MPRKLAAATVAILLGLTASPSRADDVNFLEISLLKYLPNGTNLYGIAFEAGKDGATSCEVTTPSGTSACIDTALRLDLTQAELTAEIGTGTGADWTLTWDKGLVHGDHRPHRLRHRAGERLAVPPHDQQPAGWGIGCLTRHQHRLDVAPSCRSEQCGGRALWTR